MANVVPSSAPSPGPAAVHCAALVIADGWDSDETNDAIAWDFGMRS